MKNTPLSAHNGPNKNAKKSPLRFLAGPSLAVLQPLFNRIVDKIARRHPELFERLEGHCEKRFLIIPANMPLQLLLEPDPAQPRLTALPRHKTVDCDVAICADFLTFLKMIDSRTDSDALFFSRDLSIEGDIEAVVALRNALDDMDSTLVDEVIATFGPLSRPLRHIVTFFEKPVRSAS